MAVKIRFARIGKKHAPVYRIVAVDSRKKRDGKYLENLGTYNPLTQEIVQFHDDRVAYWVSVGAVVTDSVKRLMKIRNKTVPTVVAKKTAKTEAKDVAKVEKKASTQVVKKTAKEVSKKTTTTSKAKENK